MYLTCSAFVTYLEQICRSCTFYLLGTVTHLCTCLITAVDCVWNVRAYAQKPDLVFRRTGGVHLNWRGRQFIRLVTAEVCPSPLLMLDTPRSEVVWRVLATHSIHQFLLHLPSRASQRAITFQLEFNTQSPHTKLRALSICFGHATVTN